jgi:hypothetical protein
MATVIYLEPKLKKKTFCCLKRIGHINGAAFDGELFVINLSSFMNHICLVLPLKEKAHMKWEP